MTTNCNGFLPGAILSAILYKSLSKSRHLGCCIAWRDSGKTFSKNFSAGAILSAILNESHSKLHHFGCCVFVYAKKYLSTFLLESVIQSSFNCFYNKIIFI
jgi:hypothetical protein